MAPEVQLQMRKKKKKKATGNGATSQTPTVLRTEPERTRHGACTKVNTEAATLVASIAFTTQCTCTPTLQYAF